MGNFHIICLKYHTSHKLVVWAAKSPTRHSIVRVLAAHTMYASVNHEHNDLCGRWRPRSDHTNKQAGPSLHCRSCHYDRSDVLLLVQLGFI